MVYKINLFDASDKLLKKEEVQEMRQMLLIAGLWLSMSWGAWARTVIVEITRVRNDQGNVLVMARAGKETKPVYGMAKAQKGKLTIRLESVVWEKFDLSIIHDENENWQMDLLEGKGPAEGYALKSCEARGEETTIKVRLYYPSKE